MTKKLVAALIIAGALVLVGGEFAVRVLIKQGANTGEEDVIKPPEGLIAELKVGRYYLEGGTEDEYMEVFSDGTLQFFGLDYLKLVCELNAGLVASMSEEEFKEYAAAHQDLVDFWNSRHTYWLSDKIRFIELVDNNPASEQLGPKIGLGVSYTDENTILWDDDHIYKFAE